MKQSITLLFGLIFFASTLTWFAFPQTASQLLISLNNVTAGLSANSIQTSIGEIHYLEGGLDKGTGDTVVLLHGIYARKEHWVDLIRNLTPHYHIIALDLPGFGDNELLSSDQYLLENQANNLDLVLQALNIDSAHIAANSMGAQVAGLLAVKKPELFLTLSFIGSPLGVPGVIKSDMNIALENGDVPLLVKSKSDFEERNKWLFPKTPFIPGPIMKAWMQQELSNTNKNEQIWYAANNFDNTPRLIEIAPLLTMKTFIVWCNEDRIFHISGASLLDESLSKSRLEILGNCGHVPMLDKPQEVSDLYLSFLKRAQN